MQHTHAYCKAFADGYLRGNHIGDGRVREFTCDEGDATEQAWTPAAALFCRENTSDQTAIAAQIDAQFPAYLEIREALERIQSMMHCAANGGLKTPGKPDKVGDCKRVMREARGLAEAALAKARKDA